MTKLRRVFFTGTAVSIISGAVLTAVGLLSSTKWQISALVGLDALLIGILITALYSFAQRLDQIDQNRISVEPLQHLYEVPHIELPLVRIVDAVASTHNARSDFLTNRTTEAVEKFSGVVTDMANGTFACSSQDEEVDLVKGALSETGEEVRAVASRGMEWWLKPEADVYFQAYCEAARRIAVTRIFLIDKSDLDRARPMLSGHGAAGIRTYALDRTQVPDRRQRGLVLFDNTLLHRAAPQREGVSNPKDVEFTDVADEIRGAEADFEFLLEMALAHDHNPPVCLFAVVPGGKKFRAARFRGSRA